MANPLYFNNQKGEARAKTAPAPAPGFLERAGAETASRFLVAAPQP